MIRPLLALALLALALPAQWLGPTNVWLENGTRADVFLHGGRIYLLMFNPINPRVEFTIFDAQSSPRRMPAELRLCALAAHDPRPCARQTATNPSELLWNDTQTPTPWGWTIKPDGWLWWLDMTGPDRIRSGPRTYFLTYQGVSHSYTPCSPVGDPALTAMLFEVALL